MVKIETITSIKNQQVVEARELVSTSGRERRQKYLRSYSFLLLCVFFIFVGMSMLFPAVALADGGAPNLAYVAGTAGGISAIDVAQQKVTRQIAIDGKPQMMVLSVDGRTLAVTQPDKGQVTILATLTAQALCTAHLPGHPSLLTFDPGTNTLYASGTDTNQVHALDPLTCATRHVFAVQGQVTGMAVAVVGGGIAGGTGNQLWIASTEKLTIFSTEGSQLATLTVAGGPQYLSIPSGPTAYVTTRQGTLVAIDVNSRQRTPPLLTNGVFGLMDYDATTGEVYVPDIAHQRIDVLSAVRVDETPLHHQPERVLRFSASPQSVAITNDGQLGFVALANGDVAMLAIPDRQTITTLRVGGHPQFVITGLYPSSISYTPQQSIILAFLNNLAHYGAALLVAIVTIVLLIYNRIHTRGIKRS